MDRIRRVFAIGTICTIAAAIAPGTPRAGRLDHRTWAPNAIPQATLETAGKASGLSALSSDGRVAVVPSTRAVAVFRASSEDSWSGIAKPAARLRLPRWAIANLAAVAVSSDGTTVVVAAGAAGSNPAVVYVFHVRSPHTWRSSITPTAKLTNAMDPAGFGAGVALSADGTTLLVGDLGGADVFHAAAAASWQNSSKPTATLVASAVAAQEGGLGITVALSADGTTALIGAANLSTFVGAAYIFRTSAADAWISSATPDAVLTDGAIGMFGDGFGGAVALSPDGTTALVGAPNLAFGPAGAAYGFRVPSPDAWTSTADPDAIVEQRAGGKSGEVAGWSVALSDEGTAVVGEPSVLGEAGTAAVLHFSGADQPTGLGTVSRASLTNAASPPGDLFGASVGLSSDGTTALVSSVAATSIFTRSPTPGAAPCYVPYVEGEALRAAVRGIDSTHCRVGRVTRVRASRSRSNHVVSQMPRPGARLPKGATVALRVGQRLPS